MSFGGDSGGGQSPGFGSQLGAYVSNALGRGVGALAMLAELQSGRGLYPFLANRERAGQDPAFRSGAGPFEAGLYQYGVAPQTRPTPVPPGGVQPGEEGPQTQQQASLPPTETVMGANLPPLTPQSQVQQELATLQAQQLAQLTPDQKARLAKAQLKVPVTVADVLGGAAPGGGPTGGPGVGPGASGAAGGASPLHVGRITTDPYGGVKGVQYAPDRGPMYLPDGSMVPEGTQVGYTPDGRAFILPRGPETPAHAGGVAGAKEQEKINAQIRAVEQYKKDHPGAAKTVDAAGGATPQPGQPQAPPADPNAGQPGYHPAPEDPNTIGYPSPAFAEGAPGVVQERGLIPPGWTPGQPTNVQPGMMNQGTVPRVPPGGVPPKAPVGDQPMQERIKIGPITQAPAPRPNLIDYEAYVGSMDAQHPQGVRPANIPENVTWEQAAMIVDFSKLPAAERGVIEESLENLKMVRAAKRQLMGEVLPNGQVVPPDETTVNHRKNRLLNFLVAKDNESFRNYWTNDWQSAGERDYLTNMGALSARAPGPMLHGIRNAALISQMKVHLPSTYDLYDYSVEHLNWLDNYLTDRVQAMRNVDEVIRNSRQPTAGTTTHGIQVEIQ